MTDFLTVLTCTPGRRCAKAYGPDVSVPPEPYDAGWLFAVEQVEVASLSGLAEVLDSLRAMPERMVIRDQLRPDALPAPNGLYARRRVDRPNDPAPFEPAEHYWAMFDADATATPFDPADPVGSVRNFRKMLPPPMRQAAMIFQFSAKQHLTATVRGHAWVWLAEPVGNVPLARWAARNGLDPALYHAVQPHYTADPVFPEGTPDPLARGANGRSLVVLEGSEAVELDFTEEDHREGALLSQGGQRLSSVHLAEVGDPSDAPEAVEARARIVKQLEAAFAGPGKRWDLCGHVGGACANAGAPPEEACAILEALRAGDVPDHDFAAGLQWALGAYSFSARPMGVKGISLLCGPIATIKVSDALRTLGAMYAEPTPEEEATAMALASAPADPFPGLPFDAFDHDSEPEEIPYIIPALNLGPGKPSAIVGYAYSSKTPWALELAVCVASGAEKFQGHTIAYSVRVLYVATEGARNARRKAARIAIAHGTTLAKIGARLVIVQAPPGFLTVETAERVGDQADTSGFGLVLVDTYNSAFDGAKDRNTNDFSMALKVFGDISDRVQITFVALLHCRKGTKDTKGRAPTLQEIDGHNSIAGAVQCAVGLWRPEPEQKLTIAVECVRAVDDGFEAYCIEWKDTPAPGATLGLRSEVVDMPAGDSDGKEQTAERIAKDREVVWQKTIKYLTATPRGISGRDHARLGMGGVSQALKSRVLEEMVAAGAVVETTTELGGFCYALAAGPKAAEARAKHQGAGFLAGGAPGKKPTPKKGGGGG